MSKLCAKSAVFFYAAATLGLAACGGQTVKPEEDVVTEVVAEPVVAKQEPVVEVKPEPVVEVTPQKVVGDQQIAVEAIPAKSVNEESVKQAAPQQGVLDQEKNAENKNVSVAKQSVAKQETAVEEKPAVSPAPAAESAAPEASVVSAPKSEKKSVPTASGPNHFVVTVGPKEPSHPAYGKGHTMGFLVDGVSGKELVLERGKTYTFEIKTNPKHDVYISKKAIGWGAAPYVKGVSGMYTYMGTITLTVDKYTPDILYYACRNHPYMGSVIHVVDPGQTVDIKQQTAGTKAAGGSVARKAANVTKAKVKQKLMFA